MRLRDKIIANLPDLQEANGVHARHCRHCPSRGGSSDKECDDILMLPLEGRAATCFPCGWNGDKLCRGYVDLMSLTDSQAMQGYLSKLG
jgi:hypothetical protein